MTGFDAERLLEPLVALCQDAGAAIMGVYARRTEWAVTLKADESPVTAADMASHHVLVGGLPALLDVPVLSEESTMPSYEVRRQWQTYWLVDPLDGTKEFISGTDDFTVNVALIHHGEPVLGVIQVPPTGVIYSGYVQADTRHAEKRTSAGTTTLRVRPLQRDTAAQPMTVVTSRRHGVQEARALADSLAGRFGPIVTRDIGSSLKMCLIAEGAADFYPRLAPTSEWDTAAAQAILEAAGGALLDASSHTRLRYNTKAELLNPNFYAVGDTSVAWSTLLSGA